MKALRICVLGGTGFVGSHLVHRLSSAGHAVSVVSRRPERHRGLLIDRGVTLVKAGASDSDALRELFVTCDAVINLIGILNESGSSRFQTAHVEAPRAIVKAMREAGVTRLLHMSALNANVNEPNSRYLKTKGEGEDLVHHAPGLAVTSFRPSVIFGPGDSFFNRFASLLRMSPPLFPLACAAARFAPVYVGDVVEAMLKAVQDDKLAGRRLELCGPQVYTLQKLVQYTAGQIGKHTLVVGIPDFAARLQGHLLGLVPGKPFTIDNYHSLQKDSVCAAPAFAALDIEPRSVEAIVPTYLGEARSRARYTRYRANARREG
jgi:uncharacterized protein YbjT (DUF2867 family)